MSKIIVTGSNGRFGKILKSFNKKEFIFKNKIQLNILSRRSISKNLKKYKPKYILHLAGLSRPMNIHNKNIIKSIDLNIIGTCNLVQEASKLGIKMIYLSTSYVYPGIKGKYKEDDALKPWNNYSWSKLGGECAVTMYKKSLILRITMCEKPFMHKKAFYDIEANYIFHDDVIKIIPKILNKNGIINVGGKIQSVYNFAKKNKKNVIKVSGKKVFPPKPSMNVSKINKIMKW